MGTHTVNDAKREVGGREMRSDVDRDLWSGRDSNPRPPACKAPWTMTDSYITPVRPLSSLSNSVTSKLGMHGSLPQVRA